MSVSVSPLKENYSFKFVVRNFLRRPEANKEFIDSPKFDVRDLNGKFGECRLKIYPKGFDEEAEGYVSIYLVNLSKTVLTMTYTLKQLKKDNIQTKTTAVKRSVMPPGRACVSTHFVSNDKLKKHKSNLLPDGKLIIVLELSKHKPGPEESSASCFIREMGQAFKENKFTDITIVCKGQKFECHKFVLCARSPVFRAMFSSGFMESNSSQITLDIIRPEIFKEMLSFIYCGEPKNLDANAVDLLQAADQYQLDHLKEICGFHLRKQVCKENCLDYLVLSNTHSEKHLKQFAMEFVVENIKSLMKTPNWKTIGMKNPELMMEVMEEIVNKKDEKMLLII